MMDHNKLRKIAGLPLLTERQMQQLEEAKKKKPIEEPVEGETPTGDELPADDLPAIISKIAGNLAKKFGIGAPDGSDSKDLQAVKDFLMKVYEAGIADGKSQGE